MDRFGQCLSGAIKYMTDTMPYRISLQNMEKKASEMFQEYAHKWKDLASQVRPPMIDKGLNKMFLNTLKTPYYDRIIGNSNKKISDVVFAGQMIENGVKLNKIEITKAKMSIPKKKERETHAVSYQGKPYNPSYSQQPSCAYQTYNQYAGSSSQRNYQSNYRLVACFPTLPSPTYGGPSQLTG